MELSTLISNSILLYQVKTAESVQKHAVIDNMIFIHLTRKVSW
jgi:hypothetical protein